MRDIRDAGVEQSNCRRSGHRKFVHNYWPHSLLWSVGLVVSAVCVNLLRAQPVEPVELEHFRFVRAITLSDPDSVLPEELLIAQIKNLDVAADGRLLVVDRLGRQAFVFDPHGNLKAALDPSVCHPGSGAMPIHAKFVGDESILLSMSGPWGYRFTADGGCLGRVDEDFELESNPGLLDTDARGGLFGVYRYPDKQVARLMNASGKALAEFELPQSDYPNATYRLSMGGFVVDERYQFYAGVVEPHILKLTRDGMVVDRISHRTSWFRDVSEDLPDLDRGNRAALMQAGGQLMMSSTLASGLFELSDATIMVQYSNGDRGRGYQVFTKDGQLIAQELGIQVKFKYGKDGLVYRAVQPELDAKGDLPNPYIEVYQFITP